MCGIVGFIGNKNGTDLILKGLKNLNYRGYDSAGIVALEKGKFKIVKKCGKINRLEQQINQDGILKSSCLMGHTRWATHGEPSDVNAHPIEVGDVVVVHNGIIENHLNLKNRLKDYGYKFETQTDTEAAAALIDFYYKKTDDALKAVLKAASEFEGSFALGVMFKNNENIYAVKQGSPLVVGFSSDGNYIASDLIAFSKQTKNYVVLDENEACVIEKNKVNFYNIEGKTIEKKISKIDWIDEGVFKHDFKNFMTKEIFEQPEVVRRCFKNRLIDSGVSFVADGIGDEWFSQFDRFHFVACGTAMHAGLFGKHLIESIAKKPAQVSIASEFRYCEPVFLKNDLVIVISQSGETADSLAALKLAQKHGIATLGIVNVKTSTIAREADKVILTNAGPEIAVASTKAFSAQIAVIYLLVLKLAQIFKTQTKDQLLNYYYLLNNLPEKIEETLTLNKQVFKLSTKFYLRHNLFFIGRSLDYYLALESSLKLKELSYIHSEAYAAGELKHGTISLIEPGVLLIAIATQKSIFSKTINNVKEVKARGAEIFIICCEDCELEENLADYVLKIPNIDDFIAPFCAIIPMQLFACYVAELKGCDVDMPRNLAKSVTVE